MCVRKLMIDRVINFFSFPFHLTALCKCSNTSCNPYKNLNLLKFKATIASKDKVIERSRVKKSNDQQEVVISKAISDGSLKSILEIDKLKKFVVTLGRVISNSNFDSVFLDICRRNDGFTVGRKYFLDLYSSDKFSIASAGKFFRLCYTYKQFCNDGDKELIKKLYAQLIHKYGVLDSMTCENAASGLAITDKWKEGVKLIKMASDMTSPSSFLYSVVTEAAFLNSDVELGWTLLEEMFYYEKKPSLDLYSLLISQDKDNILPKFLALVEKYNVKLNEAVADMIIVAINGNKSSKSWAQLTKISDDGRCQSCMRHLLPVSLEDEEFNELRDAFLKPVLIGKDIYLKSKPAELKSYLKFLSGCGRVDVVLDGLNIAYAGRLKHPEGQAKMIRDVVQHFNAQTLKVMVLGRKHMLSWKNVHMEHIKKNAVCFFADNLSADDPLILYAALHSGLGTIFVSRDMMRGHKFLLKDSKLRLIFSKWQQKHHYYLNYIQADGRVFLKPPLPYLQDAQSSKGMYHLPIVTDQSGVAAHLQAAQVTWLCLGWKPSSQTKP